MWKFVRNVIGFLLLPLLYVVLVEAYSAVAPHLSLRPFLPALLGFLAYVVLHLAFFRDYHLFTTLEHEFGHAAMGCLFLRAPQAIAGSATQGGVTAVPNGYNPAIALAPYFLPLVTVPLLVVKAVVLHWNLLPSWGLTTLDVLIGFTYAFHLVGLAEEYRFYQTDLQRSGQLFSIVIVALLNVLLFLVIVALVLGEASLLGSFFQATVAGVKEIYPALWQKARNLDLSALWDRLG